MNDVLATMMSRSLQNTKNLAGLSTAARSKNDSKATDTLDFSSYLGRVFTNFKDDARSKSAPRAVETRPAAKKQTPDDNTQDVNLMAAQMQSAAASDASKTDNDNDMDVTGQTAAEPGGAAKLKAIVAQLVSKPGGETVNNIFELLAKGGIDAETLLQMMDEGGEGFAAKLGQILGDEMLSELNISAASVKESQQGDILEGLAARAEMARAAVTVPKEAPAEQAADPAQDAGTETAANVIVAATGENGETQAEDGKDQKGGAGHGSEQKKTVAVTEAPVHGQGFKVSEANAGMKAEAAEPKAANVPVRQVIDQIVQNARLAQTNGLKTMEISLDPKTLGRLSIVLTAGEDGVHATIKASNDMTRNMLSQNLAELQNTLKDSGVNMKSIDITSAQLGWDFARGEGQGKRNQPQQDGKARKIEGIEAMFGTSAGMPLEEIKLAAAPSGMVGYSESAAVFDSGLIASVDFKA